jgi:hypothetical protein
VKDSREKSVDSSSTDASKKPPPLTWAEQSDRLAALMVASAKRLATDEKRLAEIKKLLF